MSRVPLVRLRSVSWCCCLLLLLAGAVCAQPTATWISLEDGLGAPDYPFGLNVSPDGTCYHVALAGTFSSPNQQVAVVNRAVGAVVARYTVGAFPEEIAYEVIPGGPQSPPRAAKLFVTNSSSSSVSVLDANGQVLGTIALGSYNYPFGIAMAPDGKRLVVTTKNHKVFVIDAGTLTVAATLNLSGFHGRPAFLPDGRVVFGSAVPVGSETQVNATFLDLDKPSALTTLVLVPPTSGWPSVEDVALVADGREAWFPTLGADSTVRRVDTLTGKAVGSVSLKSFYPSGGLHGIAANGEGLVIVTSVGGGETDLALLQTSPPKIISSIVLPYAQQPNDAVFTPDGREACVTMQYALAGVYVISGLPEPELRLTADTLTPVRGGAFQLELRGAQGFAAAVIGLSLSGPGPVTVLGETILLSPPVYPLWSGHQDIRGRAQPAAVSVPDHPVVKGLRIYLHALVQEKRARLRVSNGLQLVVR